MSWIGNEVDTFDCRIRTWFIEAATCTKDVVILLDNSGSMTGMRKHIAAFTVKNILDTFSNNDYINLLNFSTTVDFIVPCFKDQLIQATRENIQVFKDAVEGLEANDKSELTQGLTQSLNLLQEVIAPYTQMHAFILFGNFSTENDGAVATAVRTAIRPLCSSPTACRRTWARRCWSTTFWTTGLANRCAFSRTW